MLTVCISFVAVKYVFILQYVILTVLAIFVGNFRTISSNACRINLDFLLSFIFQTTKSYKKKKLEVPTKSSSSVSADPAKLKESADMVVKYLTPYFKEGKIASKVSQNWFLCLLLYINKVLSQNTFLANSLVFKRKK